jgi:DNA-directed RNA polymerase specialized sigma24 family protein
MDIEAARRIAYAIATPYARRFCLDVDEARQIAWIAAWRAVESFDDSRKTKLKNWMLDCIRRGLADWRRNSSEWGKGSPVVGSAKYGNFAPLRSSEKMGVLLADERGPPGWVAVDDADEAAAITRRAFGGELIRRRYLAGETVKEIAASLGVHPTRVDQVLRQAIGEIRAGMTG